MKKPSISSLIGFGVEWSREAQATFKLLRTDGDSDKSVVKCLPRKTFENQYLSHGIDDFIEWDEFLKHHAPLVTFEINISASPLTPKRNTIQKMIPISRKMLFVIERPREMKNMEKKISSKIVVQGIRWRVSVMKEGEYLTVFLYGYYNDMDANWCYKVNARFTLLGKSDLDSKEVAEYERGNNCMGLPQFLKWSEFVDGTKGYIKGRKAEIIVEIKGVDREPKWRLQCPTPLKTSSSFECISTPS